MSLLAVDGLSKTYRTPGRPAQQALTDVHLTVGRGEVVGLVGESGSGKSTLLRCVMKLVQPDAGSLAFDGRNLLTLGRTALRDYRRQVQMVHQDPAGSLNPRMTAHQLVAEGLLVHRRDLPAAARREKVAGLLETVGINPAHQHRHPATFSGGQLQRIAIARALAVSPRLLVCDEPVSALDVSVQAQVLNLLLDMREQLGLSILFVSHDLAVVDHLCSRVYVLRTGRIVEEGSREQILAEPRHPYTRQLLDAAPDPDRALAARA
jgi:ABC-type oligopeptide transport system ATPase subunit